MLEVPSPSCLQMILHRSIPFLNNVKVCKLTTHIPDTVDPENAQQASHLYENCTTSWHLKLPECYRLVAAVATCFHNLEDLSLELALDGKCSSHVFPLDNSPVAEYDTARATLLGPLAALTELSQLTVIYSSIIQALLQVGVVAAAC